MLARLLFAAGLASLCAAQDAPVMKALEPLRVGAVEWGRDGYFKLKWHHEADGRFLGVDVARSRRELWVLSSPRHREDAFELTVLDARGEASRQAPIDARVKKFHVWEAGGRLPRVAAMDELGVAAFSADGAKLWSFVVPRTAPSDIETAGKVLVAAYGYGDAGLRAVDLKGRLAWELPDLPRAGWLGPGPSSGRRAVAATDGVGRVLLVDARGRIVQRISGPGNLDRVAFADGRRLYGLDSSAGSWTEVLSLFTADPREKKDGWKVEKAEDLGPITVTALTAGRFDAAPRPQLALGTDNGWVFLLDDDGRPLTQARFRGKISSLHAIDLDGDGRDELVVGVDGFSGNVFVFSRPAAVSAR